MIARRWVQMFVRLGTLRRTTCGLVRRRAASCGLVRRRASSSDLDGRESRFSTV